MSTLGPERPRDIAQPEGRCERFAELDRLIARGRLCKWCERPASLGKDTCKLHTRRPIDTLARDPDRCRVCGGKPIADGFCIKHISRAEPKIPDHLL